ncbi:hypothetical protein [Halorussus lipolyticus]|uniref:hypothetical protein n=1 Tax=Halorussus lipolyticus TaxID=3034024 RepID=UPI0023E7A5DA|nr:hypothetical protein [Halorussus sp. DT80]
MTADEELTERSDSDESPEDAPADDDRSHLDGLEDGSGCTEIWEHLSERRENDEE